MLCSFNIYELTLENLLDSSSLNISYTSKLTVTYNSSYITMSQDCCMLYMYDLINNAWDSISIESLPSGSTILQIWLSEDYFYVSTSANGTYRMNVSDTSYNFTKINLYNYPRINSGQAIINNTLYIFGGITTNQSVITNSFIMVNISNEDNFVVTDLNDFYQYPSIRYGHSIEQINGLLYLFGGFDENYLNDLWSFYTTNNTWNSLEITQNLPSPRSYYASDSSGDAFLVWGGETPIGLSNEMFILNTLKNEWKQIIPVSAENPSARKAACVIFEMPTAYVFGGITASDYSSELWIYFFDNNTYNFLTNYEYGIGYASCQLFKDSFAFYCSSNSNNTLIKGIPIYNLTTSTWSMYSNSTLTYSSGIGFFLNDYFITYGGKDSFNNAIGNLSIYQHESLLFNKDMDFYPYNGAGVYYQSKLYFHNGGQSWNDPINPLIRYVQDTAASSVFGYIDIIDLVTELHLELICSPGTYASNDICNICPSGSYAEVYGSLNCNYCRQGTYNPNPGGSSSEQCYPCPEGMYSSNTGSSFCYECLTINYCPAGSIFPLSSSPNLSVSSIQPNQYNNSLFTSNYTSFQMLTLFLGNLFVFIIIFFIGVKIDLSILDTFQNQHNYKTNDYLKNQSTKIGGFFTLILGYFSVIIIGVVLIRFVLQNISETKAQQPLPVLENYVTDFAADIEVTVTFLYYGDSCGLNSICNSFINIAVNDFIWNNGFYTCEKINGSCIIAFICNSCIIGSLSSLVFTLSEDFSYSSGIYINVTSTTSIPNSISNIFIPIYPTNGFIFTGSVASNFTFIMTPSLFQSSISGLPSQATGYHVILSEPPIIGSQALVTDLADVSDLSVIVSLSKSSAGLLITRSEIQSFYTMIAGLLGSIAGLMQIISFIMRIFEKYYLKKITELNKRKQLLNIIENSLSTRENFYQEPDQDIQDKIILSSNAELNLSVKRDPDQTAFFG